MEKPTETSPAKPALPLSEIEAAIRSIRFGVVQIIIQDGVVVQIDKTEKQRLR
ncbi:YezD family protein [Armatimonas sp.]|uniref:YezD family protein n=1 Tax=Armatimonas sp. TaxID=1872638 RepID=UPI003751D7FB